MHLKNNNPITRVDVRAKQVETHLERINREFSDGFDFLSKYPQSVTIFGSSLAARDSRHYKLAYDTAQRISSELKYAVLTGGGPGIMEAGNKGAYDAGGVSLGLNISLPHEHSVNPYVTHSMKFAYFFSRKAMLSFAAEAYIFYPGGFGTMDELFSVLTLIQTGKIPRVPVILMDSYFWHPVMHMMDKTFRGAYQTIEDRDLSLCRVTDDIDEVISIIKKAPVSEWWRNIN